MKMDSAIVYASTAVASLVALVAFTGGIRKNAIRALGLYKKARGYYLRFTGGRTEQSECERRVVTGKAWEDWCDSLKAAGAALVAPGCPQDPFNQAEGYRYLSRLVRGSLESFMECNDPTAPQLVALANGLRDCPIKLGSDNPDNLYQSANLDSRETYILRGKRGTVNYLGFGTQAGAYGQMGGLETVQYVDFEDLKYVEDDKSFEILLSGTPPLEENKNWLELRSPPKGPIRAMLIVRQTFMDRVGEIPAEFELERISGAHRPSTWNCERLEEALQTSAMFVCGAPMMFSNWCAGFQKHKNTLPLFDQKLSNSVGGDPQIRYYHSYWELKDQQDCLMIETTPPECDHWNFQLNNHWMESLDYRYFTIHVNKHSAKYDDKGGVRVIVSHLNPEDHCNEATLAKIRPYNWIDTCSHHQGQMLWRWVKPGCEDSELPSLKTRVVKLGEFV